MKLYSDGLIIVLEDQNGKKVAEYQACTHGGWAKYFRGQHINNFDSRADILADAKLNAVAAGCNHLDVSEF